MSYSFCGSAVHATCEQVLHSLEQIAKSQRGKLEKCISGSKPEAGCFDFKIKQDGEWTIMAWLHEQCLVPAIVLDLSRTCDASVISVDQIETVGYEHFSWLEHGSEYMIFTYCDGVCDEVNIDYTNWFEKYKKSKQVWLPKGLDAEQIRDRTFDVFNHIISPINVEEKTLALFEAKRIPVYRLKAPALAKQDMGRYTDTFWKELTSTRKKTRGDKA